ncbi:MAG: hypothetical protein JRH20_32035 [Deltaproteobacteria bacterium]|nr:hypothetical protein [Deltaproteobacteria bacterium]
MPRYTKTTKRFERFFEIFHDGTSVVYTAKGQRAAGTSDEWTMKDSDLRANLFAENPEAAKPFYDKSIAKMLKDGFELHGDEVPIITPFREEHMTSSNSTPSSKNMDWSRSFERAKRSTSWGGSLPIGMSFTSFRLRAPSSWSEQAPSARRGARARSSMDPRKPR